MLTVSFCQGLDKRIEPLQVSVDGHKTAEDAMQEAAAVVGCSPVTWSLLGLRNTSNKDAKDWLAPSQPLKNLGPEEREVQLRVRFRTPTMQRLEELDPSLFMYLFYQVRGDFLAGELSVLQEDGLGLIVTDILHHMLVTGEHRMSSLPLREFMPAALNKYMMRKNVNDYVKHKYLNDMSGYDPSFLRRQYLDKVETCVRARGVGDSDVGGVWGVEEQLLQVDERGKVVAARLMVAPFHHTQPGLRISHSKKGGWSLLCHITDIVFISIRWSDRTVEVSRQTGVPCYFKMLTVQCLKSLVSGLVGYYRLLKYWTFDLCGEMPTPSVVANKKDKCHGPIGTVFAHHKLRCKGDDEVGVAVLRRSSRAVNTWRLDVLQEQLPDESAQPVQATQYSDPQHCRINTFTITRCQGKYKMEGVKGMGSYDTLSLLITTLINRSKNCDASECSSNHVISYKTCTVTPNTGITNGHGSTSTINALDEGSEEDRIRRGKGERNSTTSRGEVAGGGERQQRGSTSTLSDKGSRQTSFKQQNQGSTSTLPMSENRSSRSSEKGSTSSLSSKTGHQNSTSSGSPKPGKPDSSSSSSVAGPPPVFLTRLLPPSNYDKAPQLLLCVDSKQDQQQHREEDHGPKVYNIEQFVVEGGGVLQGSFYKVVHARRVVDNKKKVAIKVPPLDAVEHSQQFLAMCSEWIRGGGGEGGGCDALVACLGVVLLPLALVVEWVPLGPLDVYLKQHSNELKEVDLLEAVTLLARALHFLSEASVHHNNIRCHSLLVARHVPGQEFIVKLSEPGAPCVDASSIHWIPREHQPHPPTALLDPSTDCWAFATTAWQIFSQGVLPLHGGDLDEIKSLYAAGWLLPQPPTCPLALYQIMKRCWAADPQTRQQPQGIMRDTYEILYQVHNSRRVHAYTTVPYSADDDEEEEDSLYDESPLTVSKNDNNHVGDGDGDDGGGSGYDCYEGAESIRTTTTVLYVSDGEEKLVVDFEESDTFGEANNGTRGGGDGGSGDGGGGGGGGVNSRVATKSGISFDGATRGLRSESTPTRTKDGAIATGRTGMAPVLSTGALCTVAEALGITNLHHLHSLHRNLPSIHQNTMEVERQEALPVSQVLVPPGTAEGDTLTPGKRVSLDDGATVIIEATIGEGQYGIVYRGRLFKGGGAGDGSGEVVAVKELKVVVGQPDDMRREIKIMKLLKHRNIVTLRGMVGNRSGVHGGGQLLMVMEYLPIGALDTYLRKGAEVSDITLLDFAYDVASGMEFLESRKIVHRDLAARNVLVASPNHVKISDFGLAQQLDTSAYYVIRTSRKLPLPWYSPESIEKGQYSHKTDVWSYGVTCWEMFTRGAVPFLLQDGAKLLEALKCGIRLNCQQPCPMAVYSRLIIVCWDHNSRDRPSFYQLRDKVAELKQDFLNGTQ